jgi:CubicO group peptidase (beta-lactamase class C family)
MYDKDQAKIRKDNSEIQVNKKGNLFTLSNHKLMGKSEIPSVGNHCSGRGMSRLAAFMANKGTFEGQTLLSEPIWEQFHSDAKVEQDWPMGMRTSFTKGGVMQYGLERVKDHPRLNGIMNQGHCDQVDSMMHANRAGWYGWGGFGGSTMQWHPDYRIGFGYATTDLYSVDFTNCRASVMQKAVVDAIQRK